MDKRNRAREMLAERRHKSTNERGLPPRQQRYKTLDWRGKKGGTRGKPEREKKEGAHASNRLTGAERKRTGGNGAVTLRDESQEGKFKWKKKAEMEEIKTN